MIKRRLVRRSESNVSILLDPGGNQVEFGAGVSYFYECGLEESSNFSHWKSGFNDRFSLGKWNHEAHGPMWAPDAHSDVSP